MRAVDAVVRDMKRWSGLCTSAVLVFTHASNPNKAAGPSAGAVYGTLRYSISSITWSWHPRQTTSLRLAGDDCGETPTKLHASKGGNCTG
jgi:hypothetical protein